MTIPAGSIAQDPRHRKFPPPGGVPAPEISEFERLQLTYDFATWAWVAFAALAIASAFGADALDDWICAMLVATAAFLSIYIWTRGWVLGVPVLPVFSLACLVYYGVPFVTGHPVTREFEASEKLAAAGTVALVMVVMTLLWAWIARPEARRSRMVRQLQPGAADRILLYCLAGACLYQANAIFWFVNVPDQLWGVLRAILYTLGVVAAFALSHQLAAGRLGRVASVLFLGMLAVFIVLNTLTFYLYTAMEIGILALFGYFLGGGRTPWKVIVLSFMVFAVLHAGKGEMRVRYWGDAVDYAPVSATSSARLVEWFELGVNHLLNPPQLEAEAAPLIQRASLLQMVLKAQTETPEAVPYLGGTSYLPIPFLIVPRFLWPDRPTAQETLIQLNVHYGLLTRETAESTSIGWGMIAEAYANFGLAGCLALGALLGIFLGVTQRLCGRFPVLSARGIAGLIILTAMLRIEAPLALFLSSLLQSMVPLVLLSWTVMKPSPAIA